MLSQNISLFIVVSFVVSNSYSAVRSENEKLMEELSGKKKTTVELNKLPIQRTATLSERHFFAGLDAFKVKNYILALKHYNTVIIKHSKSKEVKLAYLAKSKLYAEMGLRDQAQENLHMALQLGNKISK